MLLRLIGHLPPRMQLVAAGGAGGLTFGAATLAIARPSVLPFLGIGLLILLGLVGVVFLAWKLVARRKEKGVVAGLRSGEDDAEGDSSAERRAKVAALREEFVMGLEKLRRTGVKLSEKPIFVMIGAPASGKTRLCGNSGFDFPRGGLTDRQQGIGGTLNMHWWFFDQGIILDTAGALTTSRLEGDRDRWTNFLDLLKQHRRHAPINGLVVTLPVQDLLSESEDRARDNAEMIGERVVEIRHELGVRFPIYVVITKADQLPGFSQFFRVAAAGPRAQQMLGWANPEGLDAPFESGQVDEAMDEIARQVETMRLSVLTEDVQALNPAASRRADACDEIFALADGVRRLKPRLRTYLDEIFKTDSFSKQKEPFVRGVWLTSSLQDESLFDQALRDFLGDEEFRKGRGGEPTEESRPLFIHDLFRKRIRAEYRLVTPDDSGTGRARRRRRVIAGTGIGLAACFVAAAGLGWLGWRDWIGKQEGFWQPTLLGVGQEQWTDDWRDGPRLVRKRGDDWSIIESYDELKIRLERAGDLAAETSRVPAAFWFASVVSPDIGTRDRSLLEKERRLAHARLVQRYVLLPLFEAALDRVNMGEHDPSAADVEILHEVARYLELTNAEDVVEIRSFAGRDRIEGLVKMALDDVDRDRVIEDMLVWMDELHPEVDPALDSVGAGLNEVLTAAGQRVVDRTAAIRQFEHLEEAAVKLVDAEQALTVDDEAVPSDYSERLTTWEKAAKDVQERLDTAAASDRRIEKWFDDPGAGAWTTLRSALRNERSRVLDLVTSWEGVERSDADSSTVAASLAEKDVPEFVDLVGSTEASDGEARVLTRRLAALPSVREAFGREELTKESIVGLRIGGFKSQLDALKSIEADVENMAGPDVEVLRRKVEEAREHTKGRFEELVGESPVEAVLDGSRFVAEEPSAGPSWTPPQTPLGALQAALRSSSAPPPLEVQFAATSDQNDRALRQPARIAALGRDSEALGADGPLARSIERLHQDAVEYWLMSGGGSFVDDVRLVVEDALSARQVIRHLAPRDPDGDGRIVNVAPLRHAVGDARRVARDLLDQDPRVTPQDRNEGVSETERRWLSKFADAASGDRSLARIPDWPPGDVLVTEAREPTRLLWALVGGADQGESTVAKRLRAAYDDEVERARAGLDSANGKFPFGGDGRLTQEEWDRLLQIDDAAIEALAGEEEDHKVARVLQGLGGLVDTEGKIRIKLTAVLPPVGATNGSTGLTAGTSVEIGGVRREIDRVRIRGDGVDLGEYRVPTSEPFSIGGQIQDLKLEPEHDRSCWGPLELLHAAGESEVEGTRRIRFYTPAASGTGAWFRIEIVPPSGSEAPSSDAGEGAAIEEWHELISP